MGAAHLPNPTHLPAVVTGRPLTRPITPPPPPHHPAPQVAVIPHLDGLGLGVRQLMALVAALEANVGPAAVAQLHVVICCTEGEELASIAADLRNRRLCK